MSVRSIARRAPGVPVDRPAPRGGWRRLAGPLAGLLVALAGPPVLGAQPAGDRPAGDSAALALLARAREARLAVDTALRGYRARSRERISATLGVLRDLPVERTVFRQEVAADVRWAAGEGVVVEVVGRRRHVAPPPFTRVPRGEESFAVNGDGLAPIPYYPGRDALWVGAGAFVSPDPRDEPDERVHPIAEGAERHYRYAVGDSVTITLPDGARVRLRELRITPRRAGWRLQTGSFWFDEATGQLVRAAYRTSAPIDFWREGRRSADPRDRPPRWAPWLVGPMTGGIDAITIEHGLYEGRFWLPRAQYAEGAIQAGPNRIGIRVEQTFRYDAINGSFPPLPPLGARALAQQALRDSLDTVDSVAVATREAALAAATGRADSTRAWRRYHAWADSTRRRVRRARDTVLAGECDDRAAVRERTRTRYGRRLPARVLVPCDAERLATSDVFGAPLMAEDAATWRTPDRALLLRQLEQPALDVAPGPLEFVSPLRLSRYNRVEGLSVGAGVAQRLGGGWRGQAELRIGGAERVVRGEVGLERGEVRRATGGALYRRLVQSDDYGAAFRFGASLQNVASGLDEQFYHDAVGVELTGRRRPLAPGAGQWSWRLFAERQADAPARARWTLQGRVFGNADATFAANIVDTLPVTPVRVAGAAARWQRAVGDDASPWRLAADVRGEGATGTLDWLRGAADVTLERRLPGRLRARGTASGGTSAGTLPVQRWWNVGGWQTVRGMVAGSRRGESFWMGRGELQFEGIASLQPVAFVDAGWAGRRGDWAESFRPGRMVRGGGIGAAIANGLFRFDLARGLDPGARWRFEGYAVARF